MKGDLWHVLEGVALDTELSFACGLTAARVHNSFGSPCLVPLVVRLLATSTQRQNEHHDSNIPFFDDNLTAVGGIFALIDS
jgi:hypothetical protein